MNVQLLSDCIGAPVSTERAIEWTLAMLDALALLHARGEVHGHLAPDLVRITTDRSGRSVAMLLPFESMPCSLDATPMPSLYRAPEQCRGAAASPAADLYAVGIMLHEMLTGRPPWFAIDAAQLLQAQLHEPLPALPAHARALDGFVRRLAHKRPETRFNQARIAASALRVLAANRVEIGVDAPAAPVKRRVTYPVATLTFAAALTTGTVVTMAGLVHDDPPNEPRGAVPVAAKVVAPMPVLGTPVVERVAAVAPEQRTTTSMRAPEFPPPPRVALSRRVPATRPAVAKQASAISLRSYHGQRSVQFAEADRSMAVARVDE